MKQVVISLVAVMLAAGVFAGMVLYSVSVMRQTQLQILTGEFTSVTDMAKEERITECME